MTEHARIDQLDLPSPRHMPLVNVLGIGAQKCASSWLHAIAETHPDISVSAPKEVDFFSYYFDRGYQWYERHFADRQLPIRLESSPSYFHDPRAPQRARDYNPDLRILLLLRDPVARAFSNHSHEIIKGHIPPITFEEGLINNPSYLEQGWYATHLQRWRDAFGTQVSVMFAEEIQNDPEGSARALFELLGIDPTFRSEVLSERRNESDRARFPLLRQSLRAGGDLMRRAGMGPALARIKSTGPMAKLLEANSIKIRDEIPPMAPATRQKLKAYFAPEMARLRVMLDRESLPWEKK